MANYGNRSYSQFQNVNLKGNSSFDTDQKDSGVLRMEGNGFAGTATVNVDYFDQDIAWTLPAKSGVMPIQGTVSIDLDDISASTFSTSTNVTVSGVRVEDAVTASVMNAATSTAYIFSGVTASAANQLTFYFVNIGCDATAANKTYVMSYCISR